MPAAFIGLSLLLLSSFVLTTSCLRLDDSKSEYHERLMKRYQSSADHAIVNARIDKALAAYELAFKESKLIKKQKKFESELSEEKQSAESKARLDSETWHSILARKDFAGALFLSGDFKRARQTYEDALTALEISGFEPIDYSSDIFQSRKALEELEARLISGVAFCQLYSGIEAEAGETFKKSIALHTKVVSHAEAPDNHAEDLPIDLCLDCSRRGLALLGHSGHQNANTGIGCASFPASMLDFVGDKNRANLDKSRKIQESWEILMRRGKLQEKRGNRDGAAGQYQAGLELLERSAASLDLRRQHTLKTLTLLYIGSGDLSSAARYAQQELECQRSRFGPKDPGIIASLLRLSAINLQMGKIDSSFSLAEEALSIISDDQDIAENPDFALAKSIIARATLGKGDTDSAKAALPLLIEALELLASQARQNKPAQFETGLALARAHLALGQPDKAMARAKEAGRLLQGQATPIASRQYWLLQSDIYSSIGDYKNAISALEAIVGAGGNNLPQTRQLIETAKSRLKEVRAKVERRE